MFPEEVQLASLLTKVEKLAEQFKHLPDAYGCYRALR